MFKHLIYILLIFTILITACSKNNIFEPVVKGMSPATAGKSAQNLYVLSTLNSNVSKIDLNSGNVSTITKAGNWANDIQILNNRYLLIANTGDSSIQIFDTKNNTTSYLTTGNNPEYIVSLNSTEYYVSIDDWSGSGAVARYDISGNTNATINIPGITANPWKMKIHNGKLYVACYGNTWPTYKTNAAIVVIDTSANSIIATITNKFMNLQDISFTGNYMYAVDTGQYNNTGKVYKIDLDNYSIVNTFLIKGSPGEIEVCLNGNIFVGDNGFTTSGLYLIWGNEIKNNPANSLINSGISAILYDENNIFYTYIADYSANKIYTYNVPTKEVLSTYYVSGGPVGLCLQQQ